MSFIDSAVEVLDRTEASLHTLITDALKAKAYGEIAGIAAMAQALAAISAGRGREGKRPGSGADIPPVSSSVAATAEPAKAAEPSWMRPKTP